MAPIVRRYDEPAAATLDCLVVLKSIISTACVVRTNLLDAVAALRPHGIVVAAPVMRAGAEEALRGDFPPEIGLGFRFLTFAVDDEVDPASGAVVPGVGGQVYERLGYGPPERLPSMTPDIVRERRSSSPGRFAAHV